MHHYQTHHKKIPDHHTRYSQNSEEIHKKFFLKNHLSNVQRCAYFAVEQLSYGLNQQERLYKYALQQQPAVDFHNTMIFASMNLDCGTEHCKRKRRQRKRQEGS